MDSSALISTVRGRAIPFLAILKHDLKTLASSWLVRLWFVASGILTLLITTAAWAQTPTAQLIALTMMPYLIFPWFLPIVMLGVGAVSGSQAESLADSILSRPITRYEYLLATWLARVTIVLAVFLLVVGPSALLVATADREIPIGETQVVTYYGIAVTLGVVSLAMTFLVSLAAMLGVVLRRSLVTVLVLAVLWPISGAILGTYQLEEFSPVSLNQAIPTLLCARAPWTSEPEEEEAPPDFTQGFADIASAFSFGPSKPERQERFLESDDYEDLSLWRLVLGYGVPTLLCVALATTVFSIRDL